MHDDLGSGDECSLARAAELLGMSSPSVVRRADQLQGSKNRRNEWVFSLAAVRRERAKILRKLNAVEPDAHAAEIEKLERCIDVLIARRELSDEQARLDSQVINSFRTPASPDGLTRDVR